MLTTLPQNELLDLQPWVGQRSSTFVFKWVNGLTGENLGELHPLRSGSLSHNTSSTIKRQLIINLGAAETAGVNPLTDRILLYMKLGDNSLWPLGRYVFTDASKVKFTSGELGAFALNDEMFLVDQPITSGYDATGKALPKIYTEVLADLPIEFTVEHSDFSMTQSWTAGTNLGQILDAVATTGDYFSPWFGNDTKLHAIRTFNPADQVPQLDWDTGNQVMRESINETSSILTAPNRFICVSNTNAGKGSIVGVADVPPNAPNSFANRGFYIVQNVTLQLSDAVQAQAVARGLANKGTIFETVTLNTAADPRHDSYDVIKWNGSLWLELAWNLQLTPGGQMSHTLRKGYAQ